MWLSGGFSCMRVKWNTRKKRKGVFRFSLLLRVCGVLSVAHFVLAPKSCLASLISLTKKLHYSSMFWQLLLSSGAVRGGGKGELATKGFSLLLRSESPSRKEILLAGKCRTVN